MGSQNSKPGREDVTCSSGPTAGSGLTQNREEVAGFSAGDVLGNKWELTKEIGRGAYCKVFKGKNIESGQVVAIKVEDAKAEKATLAHEFLMYKVILNCVEKVNGIPTAHYQGTQNNQAFLVLDLLGPTLQDVIDKNGNLPMRLVLGIGRQALHRLQHVHRKNIVHRDIKPANLAVGASAEEAYALYLIDFGLAKRYRYNMSLDHIANKKCTHITGTAPFMSINAHLGNELSRRDDLESLGYTLVYLFKGSLPWNKAILEGTASQKDICELKRSTSLQELCEGMPKEIVEYFSYVRALEFQETPLYSELRGLLRAARDRA